MARTKTDTTPYWETSTSFPQYARLADNADADVVVGGARVTGLTAAYLLAKAGTRVIVLDRGRCAAADTGLAAIATIDDIVREHAIDASFAWVDGYLHAPRGHDASDVSDLGRANPWTELFDPGRKALTRGLWDYVKENVDYPYYMIRARVAGAQAKSLREVRRGQGKVIERKGAKVAAYRDEDGAVTLRSAICTHMGCTVAWNTAERTWDCPCHGSRFTPAGDVISGPAETSLPSAD